MVYKLMRLLRINKFHIMDRLISLIAGLALAAAVPFQGEACTGIALTAKDGSRVVARTTEWGGSVLNSSYVVVPRGHQHVSFTPSGQDGMQFAAKYGYVGICTDRPEFVVEGMNEAGLSAGLFFFPNYGEYVAYNPDNKANTLSDMQFVSWVLANFSGIDEMKEAFAKIDLVSLDSRIGTVHWRISEPSGRMVVLECIEGKPVFYENKLGVLTNSPDFGWQMKNLNNYVNLYTGNVQPQSLNADITLRQFGAGAGFLGIPGDATPPSRFVRAALYQSATPQAESGEETVMQCFQILESFNIPIGLEHQKNDIPEGLPSATQWTVASDQAALKFYYRTAWNSSIRCIDIASIDFSKVKFRMNPLDESKRQPVEMIRIK